MRGEQGTSDGRWDVAWDTRWVVVPLIEMGKAKGRIDSGKEVGRQRCGFAEEEF